VSTDVRGAPAETSAAGAAAAASGPGAAAWGTVPGAGLGVAAGPMSGNRPAAFPAAMTAVPAGPGAITGNRPAAFPAPMSVVTVLVRLGSGPSGGADGPAGPGGKVLAVEGAGCEPFAPGAALWDGEPLGLEPGLGLWDEEPVALALGDALGDPLGLPLGEPAGLELVLGVGVGEPVALGAGEPVALGVALGVAVGEGEPAGLELALGVGVADAVVLGLVEGTGADGVDDADADELDAVRLGLAVEETEGEEVPEPATLASAGPGRAADRPVNRKPPVTRPATTVRRCAKHMRIAHSALLVRATDRFPLRPPMQTDVTKVTSQPGRSGWHTVRSG
jgi:hypothetical protein